MTSSAIRTFTSLDNGALDCRTGGSEAGNPQVPPVTGYTLHLPLPPSVNTFQRDKRGRPLGNHSKDVKDWIRQADLAMMLVRPLPRKVSGTFVAKFVWDRRVFGKRDGDNMVKPVFDWLQRVELIDDDKLCCGFAVCFGDAPEGCIVTVREAVFLCAE